MISLSNLQNKYTSKDIPKIYDQRFPKVKINYGKLVKIPPNKNNKLNFVYSKQSMQEKNGNHFSNFLAWSTI